jgi:hypothetical protein
MPRHRSIRRAFSVERGGPQKRAMGIGVSGGKVDNVQIRVSHGMEVRR